MLRVTSLLSGHVQRRNPGPNPATDLSQVTLCNKHRLRALPSRTFSGLFPSPLYPLPKRRLTAATGSKGCERSGGVAGSPAQGGQGPERSVTTVPEEGERHAPHCTQSRLTATASPAHSKASVGVPREKQLQISPATAQHVMQRHCRELLSNFKM